MKTKPGAMERKMLFSITPIEGAATWFYVNKVGFD